MDQLGFGPTGPLLGALYTGDVISKGRDDLDCHAMVSSASVLQISVGNDLWPLELGFTIVLVVVVFKLDRES